MTTLKSRIGALVLPHLPISKRAFQILRYEFSSLTTRSLNALNPWHHARVGALRKRTDLSINLGSGGQGLPDWVNVELRRHRDTTLCLDLRRRLPFSSASADRIFAEHVLEHLDFASDAPAFLSELRRILKPDGVVRIIVPDCERYCSAYASKSPTQWQALGWNVEALPIELSTPMQIINHTFHQGGEHLFGYDFDTLKELLIKAGFEDVQRMSFGNSLDPALAIDQPHHAIYSLYVDASAQQGTSACLEPKRD